VRDQDFAWRLEQLACPERAQASRTGRQNGSSSNPIAPTILRFFQVSEFNLGPWQGNVQFSVAGAPVRGNIAESSICRPFRCGWLAQTEALTRTKISRAKIWLGPSLPDPGEERFL